MGYFYLLCVALMFSFGGTCVKLISPTFSPAYITFFRFAVGVFFLLLLKAVKRQPFRKDFFPTARLVAGWILFGAAAKWAAYLTENYALSHGPSYGNIVTQPVQTVFLTLASVFLFKEKLPPKKLLCILERSAFGKLFPGEYSAYRALYPVRLLRRLSCAVPENDR